MAIGYYSGLNPTLTRAVTQAFTQFPTLPPRNIHIDVIQPLPNPASLETLMTQMLNAQERDFLLVLHGYRTGTGLYLPLANRNRQAVGAHVTLSALKRLIEIVNRGGVSTRYDRAALKLEDLEIGRLLALVQGLSARRPSMIEFRNCNLGQSIEMMSCLRLLLSPMWLSAPKYFSFFGHPAIGASALQLRDHARRHRGNTLSFPYRLENPAGECILCLQLDAASKPIGGHIVADSNGTLNRWIARYLGQRVQNGPAQHLPVYGLWDRNLGKLGDPLAVFNQPKLTLPMELQQGTHIVYV